MGAFKGFEISVNIYDCYAMSGGKMVGMWLHNEDNDSFDPSWEDEYKTYAKSISEYLNIFGILPQIGTQIAIEDNIDSYKIEAILINVFSKKIHIDFTNSEVIYQLI